MLSWPFKVCPNMAFFLISENNCFIYKFPIAPYRMWMKNALLKAMDICGFFLNSRRYILNWTYLLNNTFKVKKMQSYVEIRASNLFGKISLHFCWAIPVNKLTIQPFLEKEHFGMKIKLMTNFGATIYTY